MIYPAFIYKLITIYVPTWYALFMYVVIYLQGEATYKYPFTTAGSSSQEASNLQPVLESTDDESQARGKVNANK